MSNSGERSRPVRFTALRAALGWIVSALTLGGCVSFPPLTQFVQRPPDVEVVRTVDRTLASGVLVDEDFAIGGFRVEGVDRGGFLQTKPYRSSGTFTFALVSDASKLAATCTVFGAGLGRRLECRCAAEDGSSELWAESGRGASYHGGVTLEGEERVLKSVGEPELYEQMLHPGFVIGEPLYAAVQVGEPGELWLPTSLSPKARDHAVCLGVALMLFRPGHAAAGDNRGP